MRRPLLAALLAALVPACSLAPRPDTSRYFTLPEPPAAPAPAAPGTPGATSAPRATFGLGPVTWPPHLERPEVATRVDPTRIAYSTGDRWAGPLEELALGTLAAELRARIPARDVLRWPWPLGSPPEGAAAVEFSRFEADAGGGATLVARWTVTVPGRPAESAETRASEAGPPGDLAASVAAQGRLLGRLAEDIAAAARQPSGGVR